MPTEYFSAVFIEPMPAAAVFLHTSVRSMLLLLALVNRNWELG